MTDNVNKERAIRAIVRQAVEAYASGFSDRHLKELNDEDGTINMKIHKYMMLNIDPLQKLNVSNNPA